MKKLIAIVLVEFCVGSYAYTDEFQKEGSVDISNGKDICLVDTNVNYNYETVSMESNSVFVSEKRLIRVAKESGLLVAMIKELAASGEICKVIEHCWRDGRPGEGNGFMFADYHPGTSFRTCKICGVCQSKTEGEWK